jgi:hypothetical protein
MWSSRFLSHDTGTWPLSPGSVTNHFARFPDSTHGTEIVLLQGDPVRKLDNMPWKPAPDFPSVNEDPLFGGCAARIKLAPEPKVITGVDLGVTHKLEAHGGRCTVTGRWQLLLVL